MSPSDIMCEHAHYWKKSTGFIQNAASATAAAAAIVIIGDSKYYCCISDVVGDGSAQPKLSLTAPNKLILDMKK